MESLMTYASRMLVSHTFTRYSPFQFLIISNTLCAILYPSFGRQHLHSWTHSCFLLFNSALQVELICFSYFLSKISSFFVEILSFSFPQTNFECDAYLVVDHSLVYSYPKMFLLFLYLILTACAWFRPIILDSYLGIVLFVAAGSSYL